MATIPIIVTQPVRPFHSKKPPALLFPLILTQLIMLNRFRSVKGFSFFGIDRVQISKIVEGVEGWKTDFSVQIANMWGNGQNEQVGGRYSPALHI